MTLKEAEALFVELDKGSHYGDAENFNFEAMTAAVNLLVCRMESLFNCRIRVHGPMENQDSGCFSEIYIPGKVSLFGAFLEEEVSLYVSRV